MKRPTSRWLALSLALCAACGSTTEAHPSSGTAGSSSATSTLSTSTSTSTSTPAGPDTYEALSLFTNLPRFAILKASPERDLCFRLTLLSGAGMGLSGFSGDVTVESGLATHAAADCEVSGAPLPTPAGPTAPVVSGHGTVSMSAAPGCAATVHATLLFSGAPAWVPPSEALDADALTIVGGCP